METGMKLERQWKQRRSRRWFLGAAGLAGLTAIGCSGGTKSPLASRPPSPAGDSGSATTASPTAVSQDNQRGETLRFTGYVRRDADADPHKTQAGPFYGQEALVFSRLLAYESQVQGTVKPDLAIGMPEQPDGQTLTFHLNPNARFHSAPPLSGRVVNSNDVRFSIERQQQGDSSFVRKAQWANIDKIETPDPATISFHFTQPLAMMTNLFADVNAFIVAPELTDGGRRFDLNSQIGSGPFSWVEWTDGVLASVARNPRWHGGGGRPYLDGVTMMEPRDEADVEKKLRTKGLDFAFVGRPLADKLKKANLGLNEFKSGQSLFFGMRFFVASPPYDDTRLRAALSTAVDRRDMIQQFFAGSGDVNPWVSWPITRWTLPQAELTTQPGYKPGAGGRVDDLKDARAMLDAYKADKKPVADLQLLVLDDAEKSLRMGSVIRDQLKQSLDLDITVAPVGLGDLVARLLGGTAPWAAGPDTGWVDLDDWVFPYFHSTGTKNSFPIRNKDLDQLIEAQRGELNEEKRKQIGYDIQRKLLAINCGVNFVSEEVVALGQPYVRNFPLDAADGYQHRFADTWIDRTDASFRLRA
jgi:peptide/nickel transport system substrate-binding protein